MCSLPVPAQVVGGPVFRNAIVEVGRLVLVALEADEAGRRDDDDALHRGCIVIAPDNEPDRLFQLGELPGVLVVVWLRFQRDRAAAVLSPVGDLHGVGDMEHAQTPAHRRLRRPCLQLFEQAIQCGLRAGGQRVVAFAFVELDLDLVEGKCQPRVAFSDALEKRGLRTLLRSVANRLPVGQHADRRNVSAEQLGRQVAPGQGSPAFTGLAIGDEPFERPHADRLRRTSRPMRRSPPAGGTTSSR